MINDYFPLTQAQSEKFAKLYKLLAESPVNVTSIKTEEDYWFKHVLDSVYYFSQGEIDPEGIANIADIGAGGGFPGLALAITFPHINVDLVESIAKKCRFMESAASALDLGNVRIINERAENLKGAYDLVTARGVGTVAEVYKLTKHIAKKAWLMYKGERLPDELAEFTTVLKKDKLAYSIFRVEKPFTRTYFYMHKKAQTDSK